MLGVLRNPVVASTMLGLIVNLISGGQLPSVVKVSWRSDGPQSDFPFFTTLDIDL